MSFKETLDLYSSMMMNALTRGRRLKKDHLDGLAVSTVYDRIMTRKTYKKVINIYGFDIDYDIDLDSLLFEYLYVNYPKVTMRFIDYGKPIKINTNNEGIQNEYNRAITKYEETLETFNSLNSAKKKLGKVFYEKGKATKVDRHLIKRLKTRADSFEYVFDYDTKGGFYVYYKHLELSCPDVLTLDKAVSALTKLLRREKIEHQVLTGELGNYLLNFSPSGYKIANNTKSVAMLFSEENIASQSCYGEHGLVGSNGTLLGVNIENKSPQFFNMTNTKGGVVNGVLGVIGSGKSALTKGILLGHLANPNHYVGIMDYKGGEYSYILEKFENGVEIKLDECFVNFLDISTLPDILTTKEKQGFYDSAVDGTCELIEAMTNLQVHEGNFVDLAKLVKEAIRKVLSRAGVDRSLVNTYKHSKNLQYNEILEVLSVMQRQPQYDKKDRDMIHLCISRCRDYLRVSDDNRMFNKQVDLNTILNSRVVIYNFSKNQSSKDFTVEDNIRFAMMSYLNDKKTIFIKKQKKFNVLVYEELQRSGDGFILRTINHDVTGGRSDNKIIYLLFNSLNFLGASSKDAKAVASNITNMFVGLVNKNELQNLEALYDITEIRERIQLIMNNPMEYLNTFVVKMNTGILCDTAWIKMDLPEDVINSPLFKTRDTEDNSQIKSSIKDGRIA